MYARIAQFEGPADQMDEMIAAAKGQIEENWASPPEGLELAKQLWMLVDRENAKGLGIVLFESEEDMRRGDEALDAMSPQGGGSRTGVSYYEVALQKQRD
jgi:hypothetical protein